MANDIALGLVIGGAVSSSVGAAFKDVEGRIKRLDAVGAKAKVLQGTIGETMRLRAEWEKAHRSGSSTADGLRRRMEANLDGLKRQGVEVRNLSKAYEQMGKVARSAELKSRGQTQMKEGGAGLRKTGTAVAVGAAAMAVPTMVAANYQAQIRQMATWAHTAGTGDEVALAKQISAVAQAKGMSQQALAEAVGGLIEKGIDWQESADYAGLIADLVDGQGMEKETIATLFSAFKEAGVQKEDMSAMLGQVAAAGDIGAFGPKDMARYMPQLLGTIKRLGMEGPEAVRFLGASLQSQYKQTQDSASAATNMNNLLNAVISGTSQERFAKEGYDLAASITALTKSGKAENPVDAFIMLTSALVKKQDPAKAKKVEAMKAKIKASKDGSAEQEQAMVALIEAAGLANIVSDQSASDGLLAQIKYGSTIKSDMATIKETDGKTKIEADAARAREVSKSKWQSATAGIEGSLESIGTAIRPITDAFADGLTSVLSTLKTITDESPKLVSGAVVIGGAVAAVAAAWQSFKVARGIMNIGRGVLGGGSGGVQKVEVVNAGSIGAGGGVGGGSGEQSSKPGVVGELLRTGLKAVAGKKEEGAEEGGVDLAEVGLKVLDAFQEGKGGESGESGPQSVFVVNASEFGGFGGGVADGGAGRRRGSRRARSRARRRQRSPVPASPPPVPPSPPIRAGVVAKLSSAAGKISAVGKAIPGGALLEAGAKIVDTYQNAKSLDDKAEGYGSAAGGLAGTMAGAAAGAAIGSVVPIIGTVVGGMIGAYLGGMGGDALGGMAGKSWFGSKKAPDDLPSAEELERRRQEMALRPIAAPMGLTRSGSLPAVPSLGEVARSFEGSNAQSPITALMKPIAEKPVAPAMSSKLEQTNTYSPTFEINVHGDMKDPRALVNEMMPEIERRLEGMAQQSARRSMYDEPE